MNELPTSTPQAFHRKLRAMGRVAVYTLLCAVASRVPMWRANSPSIVDHYEADGTYHDFDSAKLRASFRAALLPAHA